MPPDDELREFCIREYPRLVGALGLHTGDRAIAEDLAQETLVRVWQHWNKVRQLERPEAWMFRVGSNLANSRLRRLRLELKHRDRAPNAYEDPRLDPAALALRREVADLPGRQRTALVLRFYFDLPFAEVASWMDVPESTAKTLVRRALERLRAREDLAPLEEALRAT